MAVYALVPRLTQMSIENRNNRGPDSLFGSSPSRLAMRLMGGIGAHTVRGRPVLHSSGLDPDQPVTGVGFAVAHGRRHLRFASVLLGRQDLCESVSGAAWWEVWYLTDYVITEFLVEREGLETVGL
jgi:hypothetical protein